MKGRIKKLAAALLASAMLMLPLLPVSAYADDLGNVTPGDYVDIDYTEFYDNNGNMVDAGVKFSDSNFTIAKKSITKGPSLVKSITINNRAKTVRITFNKKNGEVPKGPNVVISELALRATKTLRDGPYTILKSGTLYTYGGSLEFHVGTQTEKREMLQDGDNIFLQSGESQYIQWIQGDGYGNVTVDYGSMATLTGRVYEDDKVLYGFDDKVSDDIQSRNPDAYLQAINIKGTKFPNAPTLLILADQDQYIYVNDDGTLRESGLRWDKDEYAWKGKLNTGKDFIISDRKLRSAAAGSGSSSDSGYQDSSSEVGAKPGNPYFNPNTGGGSGIAVAISAIVAILAIAIVSVIMSTIVTVKNGRK